MLRGGIFDFHRTGMRSLVEANYVVSILRKTTPRYKDEVNQKINQLEAIGPADKLNTSRIEAQISDIIEEWNCKVRKLGAVPKGLWTVDIDAGDGYYCWKFPESSINYWHDYNSGYAGRITLEERSKLRGLKFADESTTGADAF